MALRINAHAKINLDLRVRARRADGYHELSTLFQSLALHDEIHLCRRDGRFHLACEAEGVPADTTNLVWRAAARLAASVDRSLDGLAVTLRKRVPVQAGLGGGSSDAAATLRLLAAEWRLDPSAPELARVAAEIGADVPYFLVGGTAWGTGRGDVIQPLADLPEHHVLVLLPPFGVPTAEAYRWLDDAKGDEPRPRQDDPPDWRLVHAAAEDPAAWSALVRDVRNDLEPPVVARHPEIGTAIHHLRDLGAELAMMSGSGAAVVGLFRTRASDRAGGRSGWDRTAAQANALARDRGWRLLVTRTLDRAAYERAFQPRLVEQPSESAALDAPGYPPELPPELP